MRKQKCILFFALLFYTMSCKLGHGSCIISGGQLLELKPANCRFTLPKHSIEDSMRFGKESLLNYRIKFEDSTLSMNCFVTSYGGYPKAELDLDRIKSIQKNEVVFNRNTPELLIDKTYQVNATKVGYLKYLVDMPGEKFYEGRIFFIRDNKLVTLWIFEKYKSPNYNYESMIDCILKSMKII